MRGQIDLAGRLRRGRSKFFVDRGGNQNLLIELAQEFETTDPLEIQNWGGVGDNDQRRSNASSVRRSSWNSSMP